MVFKCTVYSMIIMSFQSDIRVLLTTLNTKASSSIKPALSEQKLLTWFSLPASFDVRAAKYTQMPACGENFFTFEQPQTPSCTPAEILEAHCHTRTLLHRVAFDISLQGSCSKEGMDDNIRKKRRKIEIELEISGMALLCSTGNKYKRQCRFM